MTIQTALHRSLRHGVLFAAIGLALGAGSAHAQSAPSDNATINLVRLLVKRGVLTQGDADGLIAQANAEAAQAKTTSAPVAEAPAVRWPSPAPPRHWPGRSGHRRRPGSARHA